MCCHLLWTGLCTATHFVESGPFVGRFIVVMKRTLTPCFSDTVLLLLKCPENGGSMFLQSVGHQLQTGLPYRPQTNVDAFTTVKTADFTTKLMPAFHSFVLRCSWNSYDTLNWILFGLYSLYRRLNDQTENIKLVWLTARWYCRNCKQLCLSVYPVRARQVGCSPLPIPSSIFSLFSRRTFPV
jgi:hypothetical protein